MATLLPNLAVHLAEVIHKTKCKDCNGFLKYKSVNGSLLKYKSSSSNKNYSNEIDDKLKKQFKNTFTFSNNDINEFILLLRQDVYSYNDMDEWKKVNEKAFPKKMFLQ